MNEIEQKQFEALRKFLWHMVKRISRDANIQYYCGAMTETLHLCVEAFSTLHPEKDRKEFERSILESNVSADCDKIRLRNIVDKLENK